MVHRRAGGGGDSGVVALLLMAIFVLVPAHLAAPQKARFAFVQQGQGPHDIAGACDECHVNDPLKALESGDRVLLSTDVDNICTQCHNDDPSLSHPSGMSTNLPIPAEFPLDWRGQVTCATCHYMHREGKPDLTGYMIRTERIGRRLCEACHEGGPKGALASRHSRVMNKSHMAAKNKRAWAGTGLDSMSVQCMSCHDGTVGASAGGADMLSRATWQHARRIGASHPIGVEYPPKGRTRTKYRDRNELSPDILLFDSKVGCGSCHGAYSTKEHTLVMSNRGSALCLECHLV